MTPCQWPRRDGNMCGRRADTVVVVLDAALVESGVDELHVCGDHAPACVAGAQRRGVAVTAMADAS